MQEFAAAAKEFEQGQRQGRRRRGGARYYYALGKFAEADVEFEKYLDIKFPANLNFGDGLPEHKKQNESREEVDEALRRLARRQDARRREAATQEVRRASSRSRTTRTRSPRPPASVRSRRTSRTSCSRPRSRRTSASADDRRLRPRAGQGRRVLRRADDGCRAARRASRSTAYGVCLSKSTELGWFSDWSKLCERELGQIKPEEFPTASELRGDSDLTSRRHRRRTPREARLSEEARTHHA